SRRPGRCVRLPAEPPAAADAFQRPLRSRCQARLRRSVGLPETDMVIQQPAMAAGGPSAGQWDEKESTMRVRPVGIISSLALGLLRVPLTADTQPAGPLRRIGWLVQGNIDSAYREALLHSLRDMGYVEGQNLVIEYRSGGGAVEGLPALAAELVRLPVEVIVTGGTPPTLAAKAATSTLPIVFSGIPDPVDRGLVASWAQPGGNITGAAGSSMEVNAGKQLELLKEAVPAATRVA